MFASTAAAQFEEVRIVRTEPVQTQQPCPPGAGSVAQAPAPAPQPLVTGREALGTGAGALIGGVLGHQVGGGTGRTVATVAGVAAGGFAGYKLAEEKPKAAAPPPAQAQPAQTVCLATQYRVFYARQSGLQGDVLMSSAPTSAALMINFCGDKPCM
jgi:uncharacterized protein YcfJ